MDAEIVVPGLIINCAPVAIVTSQVNWCNPDHVSVPVIVPTEVSFEADTVETGPMNETRILEIIKNTKSVLLDLTLSLIMRTLMCSLIMFEECCVHLKIGVMSMI